MKELWILALQAFSVQGATLGQFENSISNMNGEYTISNANPSSGINWSGDYNKFEGVEYFDAYSPAISTKYGEVFWTMMDPVPLNKELVERFNGKTMAVVGYETDQVNLTPL